MFEIEIVLPYRKKVLNRNLDDCVPLRGRQPNLIVGAVQHLLSFLFTALIVKRKNVFY